MADFLSVATWNYFLRGGVAGHRKGREGKAIVEMLLNDTITASNQV